MEKGRSLARCKNCGYRLAHHHPEHQWCPRLLFNGADKPPERVGWLKTTFEDMNDKSERR